MFAFYVCGVGDETHEVERSFLGSITGFSLNGEYFACLFGGKLHLMQVCCACNTHKGYTHFVCYDIHILCTVQV